MKEPEPSLIAAWWGSLRPWLPLLLGLLALPPAVVLAWRRLGALAVPPAARRLLAPAMLAASLVIGYRMVFDQLALFDDAYISFRYARNFALGHGLVWNVGERVEGYTNFLWTLAIGLVVRITSIEAPLVGLWGSIAVFGGCLIAALGLGRDLAIGTARGAAPHSPAPLHVPVAVLLLATSPLFTAYGSTGMETGACALLLLAGTRFMVREPSPRNLALAGSILIALAATRLDCGLFYAAGSGVVGAGLLRTLRAARQAGEPLPWRAALRSGLAWAAPFSALVLLLLWKLAWYGDVLPNTFYAKSGGSSRLDQGLLYLATFLLGEQAWLALLAGAALCAIPALRPEIRRFRAFAAAGGALYAGYVCRVGGDYMYGRFLVPLLPLVAVAAEAAVHELARARRPRRAAIALGLLLASSVRPSPFAGKEHRWGQSLENEYYPVTSLRPLRVGHHAFRVGHLLGRLQAAGVEPTLGTGGIGMVGYYSRLPLVDVRGLTDRVVARRELSGRGHVGHEKVAPRRYIVKRKVHLLRARSGQDKFHPKRFRELTAVRLGRERDPWQIAVYDREMMAAIRSKAPEIRFRDFEGWLDGYILELDRKAPADVASDLLWFRRYWFDHNDDPVRLALIEARAEGRSTGPPGTAADGWQREARGP